MMTKLKLYFLILIVPFGLLSQNDSLKKTCFGIKTNALLGALFRTNGSFGASLSAEYGFSKRHAIQVSALYLIDRDSPPASGAFFKSYLQWASIVPEYRFFFSKKESYAGFYAGVYAKIVQTTDYSEISDQHSGAINSLLKYRVTSLGGGILTGYQFRIRNHFLIDVFAGFGGLADTWTNIVQSYYETPGSGGNPDRIDVRGGINIGYRF
jgi:hypothetical protein